MAYYELQHMNTNADRDYMEHVMKQHGGITVQSHNPGKFYVESGDTNMDAFKKKNPNWIVREIDRSSIPPDIRSKDTSQKQIWRDLKL